MRVLFNCPECGHPVEDGLIEMVFELDGNRVSVSNVLAKVCPNYGQQFVDGYVAENVNRLVNHVVEDVESYAKKVARPAIMPRQIAIILERTRDETSLNGRRCRRLYRPPAQVLGRRQCRDRDGGGSGVQVSGVKVGGNVTEVTQSVPAKSHDLIYLNASIPTRYPDVGRLDNQVAL